MTVTEIWIGVPATEKAQREKLDQGYRLQPHTNGGRHGQYVMAHRAIPEPWTPELVERLCQLWTSGATREEIMAEFPGRAWRTLTNRICAEDVRRPAWYLSRIRAEARQGRVMSMVRSA